MKKFTSIMIAAVLMLSLTVPAFAADNPTSGQTNLSFTYTVAEPLYEVSIPRSLSLDFGDNYLPIEVSDTANLDGKSVTITFEGTGEANYNTDSSEYSLKLYNSSANFSVFYQLFDSNGAVLTGIVGTGYLPAGKVLAKLYYDDTVTISIYVDPAYKRFIPSGEYSGYIIFGIKLV